MTDLGRMPHGPAHATSLHGVGQVAAAEEQAAPKARVKASESRIGRRVAWVMAMVGVGVVVGLLIVAFLKFVDGPTEGKVSDTLLDQARAATAQKPRAPNLLSGLAIEFQYPGIFDTVGQVRTDVHATEQYNIGSKSDYGRMIAVSVRTLPSGNLEDDSSYRFRQIKTSEYTPITQKVAAEPVVLMTKVGKQEETLFWAHQGRELTVSITSANPKDDVVQIMKTITSTVRWRK